MEESRLLIKRRRQPKTKLFLAVIVITLVLVVVNQVFVNIVASQNEVYNQQISDMRVLSQELAKDAGSIASGDEAAFAALSRARNDFASSWTLINNGASAYINTGIGFSASLPGKSDVIQASYPGIGSTWNDISNNVDLVLQNRERITAINSQAANMRSIIPILQREYEDVVETLLAGNQSLTTTAAAQRQAWLADRMALNLNQIVSGQSTPSQVDQFQEDINLFVDNHNALQNGDNALGVNRINDANARDSLDNVSAMISGIRAPADAVIAAVPDIEATMEAVANIVSSSEVLLGELSQLGNTIASGGGATQLASPIAGYALLLVMLMTIMAYGQQVIRQSQEAEQVTAEKNSKNNEAVMKLVSEISSLADGDLTVKATVGEDFTGAIADSINYAVEQLRDLVSAITSVTHEVTASTEDSKQTVESLSEASRKQTETINSVHDSIREIGDGITQVNENAQKTLDVANNSVETAVGGAEVVKDTITGMDTIRDQIQDTAKRIKRLGESSQEIGGFVSLINDIAEHTNTLSLNAAIQAAMAGDAGKGFAVVADEVHELAERSAGATRQIESLVKVIQNDIKEAVQSMEQTTSEVVSGTRLAQRAGTALDDIQRVSKELQELVDSINEASSNQTKAASEIKGSMDFIQEMTSNTTSGIEATTEFISNLGTLTERLQNAVAGFSLEANKKNRWAKRNEDREAGAGKGAGGSGMKMTDKEEDGVQGGISSSPSAASA